MACSLSRIAFLACLLSVASMIWPAGAQSQRANSAALCNTDRTERGLAACNTVLKGRADRKTRAAALLSRGHTHLALGRLAEAEKDYTEALSFAPNFAALYRDRGRVRYALGNRDGAMADFSAAIEHDPFDADNHANRGYVRLIMEDFEGAREDLRKGLFWHKQHPRSDYLIGLLHYRTGRYTDAVAAVEKARQGGFRAAETFITRALSLYRMGSFDEADKEATEGLAAFPGQADLLEARARIRLARRMPTEALADAERVVQAVPKYARAYSTRAAVRLALKELDAARADADKAVELDPKLFDAHEARAEIMLASGDRPGARAVYLTSSARTDARTAQDIASRERAAAKVAEFDKPKPIVVSELDEAELKTRCGKRDDPLRMQACDRLVETAATPQARAEMLMLRSRARPYRELLGDLELAVAAAPDYLPAALARAYGHMASYRHDRDLTPFDRAWADADSAVRRAGADAELLARALTARAAASQGKGAYEAAVADLTRLLEIDPAAPASGFYREERAGALLMAGKPDLALADLREAAERASSLPGSSHGKEDLVLALIETGALDQAVAELDQWAEQGAYRAITREALRARVALVRGDAAAARDIAAAAIAVNQFSIGAIAVRGLASARLGHALDATTDLTKALDETAGVPLKARMAGLTPGVMAELFLNRGLARVQLNQGNAARADFGEAIKSAPDRARPYAERARLLLRNDNPAALTDIAMALRIEPDEPRWQALAARINLATGDVAEAERFATAALAAPAPEPELLLLRARARLALGKFADAAADAAARLAAAPSDVEALLVRIEAHTGQGDLKAALADAEAARGVKADDARILLALAELKAKAGDAPGAIGAFEEAAGKAEAAIAANKRLGDLYASIASDQLALGYYAKAIELPARRPEDEALRMAARTARDGLIRKMTAGK